jgi:hypothetical protein
MPKKGTKLCECESPLCYEIGYPTLGNFNMSTKKNGAEDWLKHINASTELRKRSKTNRIRLAYWHFRPEDRDWNGSHWVLKKGALPVANLRLFVESSTINSLIATDAFGHQWSKTTNAIFVARIQFDRHGK